MQKQVLSTSDILQKSKPPNNNLKFKYTNINIDIQPIVSLWHTYQIWRADPKAGRLKSGSK